MPQSYNNFEYFNAKITRKLFYSKPAIYTGNNVVLPSDR